jgi:hypothetical protein
MYERKAHTYRFNIRFKPFSSNTNVSQLDKKKTNIFKKKKQQFVNLKYESADL